MVEGGKNDCGDCRDSWFVGILCEVFHLFVVGNNPLTRQAERLAALGQDLLNHTHIKHEVVVVVIFIVGVHHNSKLWVYPSEN